MIAVCVEEIDKDTYDASANPQLAGVTVSVVELSHRNRSAQWNSGNREVYDYRTGVLLLLHRWQQP